MSAGAEAPELARVPELAEALVQAQRSVKTGQVLWREGQLADAYEHLRRALSTLVVAWAEEERGSTPTLSVDAPACRALERAGYRDAAALADVLAALGRLPAPRVSSDYSPSHARLFESAWAETGRVCSFTTQLLRTPRERRRRRVARIAAVVAMLVVIAGVAIRIRAQPLVTASAVYSSDTPASYAFDGMNATEWLLPSGVTGWIEIAFRAPRTVRRVHVRNAHNRYHLDRGTKDLRVTAFAGADPVATAESSFNPVGYNAPERDLTLDGRGVTRLRLEVLSTHGVGGGLAEVTIHDR